MKKILLLLICSFYVATSAFSQICDGPLQVSIQGASSENQLEAEVTNISQPSCSGPTGELTLEITGGSPDYTIQWTKDDLDYSTEQNLTNAGGGSYEVIVTDESGCSVELGPFELEEPMVMDLVGTETHPDCNVSGDEMDGAIEITVEGGTGDYTFAWSTSDGSGLVVDEEDQSGLSGGTYTVVVTDENGCTETADFIITAPDLFSASIDGDSPSCHSDNGDANGSATLNVSGGTGDYSYDWTTTDGNGLIADAGDQSGLSAGTYTVVITDENNCTVTAEVTLDEADLMTVSLEKVDPDCSLDNGDANGSITTTVNGGNGDVSYAWTSTGGTGLEEEEQNQSELGPGMYEVIVTDENGCTAIAEITLEGPDAILVVAESVDLSCFGAHDGSVTLTEVTGGTGSEIADYSYNWNTVGGSGLSTTAPSQTGLDVGLYQLTVTDESGCTAYYEYELEAPTEISVVIDSQEDPSCHTDNGDPDGQISITASGGDEDFTYDWSSDNDADLTAGATTQENLPSGTYTIIVTDGNGCSEEREITLVEPGSIDLVSTVIPPNCDGNNGSIWIAISPEDAGTTYTYSWSTSDGSGIVAGEKQQPSLSPGTYNLEVTNQNGCTASGEYVVPEASEMTVSAESIGTILCADEETGEILVSAEGGTGVYTYSIDDEATFQESPTFEDLPAGMYTVIVKDENGCSTDVEVQVDEPAKLIGGTCTEVQDLCNVSEGEIKVQADGGVAPYTVTWTSSDGGTLNQASGQTIDDPEGFITFTGAQGGKSYSFVITDANGCSIP